MEKQESRSGLYWMRHFRLLWNRWTEFNEIWRKARSQRLLPSLCSSGRLENEMTAPASNWLKHFLLLRWTEFNETVYETRFQRPLPNLCFRADRKNKRASPVSICWDIFYLLSETTDPNSTKLDRNHDRNVFYHVCCIRADRKKFSASASYLLRHFHILRNHWMEFKETWQKVRSQLPLPSCVFRADRKNKIAAAASTWLIHFYFIFEPLNGIFRDTWKEAESYNLYQVCIFGADRENSDGCYWFDKTFSTSLNCWTEINETWQEARSQNTLPRF